MSRKIKVLGIFPSYIEVYALLFRSLEEIGADVDIVSEGWSDQSAKLPSFIKTYNYPKFFNNPTLRHLTKFLFLFFSFPRLLGKRYDVVVFWCPPPYVGAFFSPLFRLFGVKTISYTIDDLAEEAFVLDFLAPKSLNLFQRTMLWKKFRYIYVRLFEFVLTKSVNHAFVVSHWLQRVYRNFNKNVSVVPTSMDAERIISIKPKRLQEGPVITHFGQLLAHRGIFLLIDAFRIVKKSFPDAKLLLIGKGPEYEKVLEMAKKESGIVVTGFLDYEKAISLVKGSDVGVIPFLRKYRMNFTGSPGKFFEYVACGLPVVGTDAGEHAYYIRDYGVGIVCRDDPKDLAGAIVRVLGNRGLRKKFRENCRKNTIRVHFNGLFKPVRDKIVQLSKSG